VSASKTVIVSRHPAAVAFIRKNDKRFARSKVIATATKKDVAGKVVAGNLPMHLASEALAVVAIEYEGGLGPRGGEDWSIEQMQAAGAKLKIYVVREVR
jgi:hypothetical protein